MKTRTLVIIITALMTYLLVGMLSSCRTKTVTEFVAIHDTLKTHSVDTVREVAISSHVSSDNTDKYHFHGFTDKLFKTRDRTVTLNNRGDTTRVDTYTATMHYLHEKDSTGYYHKLCDILTLVAETYKSRCDSLQSVIDRQYHKKTIIKKKSILKPTLIIAFLVLSTALGVIIYQRK